MEILLIRRLTVLLLYCLFLSLGQLLAQEIPSDYKLLVILDIPKELKPGIPGEISIDSTNQYLVIDYDFKPTHLYFYKMNSWEIIGKTKVKGFAYFSSSYFDLSKNAFFVKNSYKKNKYVQIELGSFKRSKFKCKDTPLGCDYYDSTEMDYEHHSKNLELIFIHKNENYLLKFDDEKLEIYLREK